MNAYGCLALMNSGLKSGLRLIVFGFAALMPLTSNAQEESDLVGVYVGEQPGAYMQNRMSARTAYLFSAHSVNSDYWVNADVKYYIGDYADSVYINGGVTFAKEQGFPAETIHRAGGGWEVHTENHTVYGVGATLWWNSAWPEPIVRGGIYVAFYR